VQFFCPTVYIVRGFTSVYRHLVFLVDLSSVRPVDDFIVLMMLQEQLPYTMVATEDIEEVEISKARFETSDEEMKASVEVVDQLSCQLLQHPNAEEVMTREEC